MRRFLLSTAIALLCSLFLPAALKAAPDSGQADRPNVVVIMADDLGIGDPGCYNPDSRIPTPHLDRLAAEGLRFSDAHTPSAVCTPTRYGLLTGRYCWRTRLTRGVLYGYSPPLIDADRATLASMLREHGYHTGIVGKWHLGLGWQAKESARSISPDKSAAARRESLGPESVDFSQPLTAGPHTVGFDFSYIIPASLDMDPYVWIRNGQVEELPTVDDPGSKRVWSGGKGFWRPGPRAPSFRHDQVLPTIARQSVEYIRRRAEGDGPFFLYVPLNSPHTPWVPTKEFHGTSKAGPYGDFVHQSDWAVGQILAALDEHDLTERTLVVVTSDNGSHWPPGEIERWNHRANADWRGMKADIWEGGHRVPLIVRWPGVVAPEGTSDQTVCLTDLFATLAAVVGHRLDRAEAEDSFDLTPVLRDEATEPTTLGEQRPIRPATVHHSLDGTFAIRRGAWKMVEGNLGSGGFSPPRVGPPKPGGPAGQLYHLGDDPSEHDNRWQGEPETVGELTRMLERFREEGRTRHPRPGGRPGSPAR
jgi:arylsulfatase A-like enzyme